MPREKVLCPCNKYHKNRFVHPATRRRHLRESNRLDLLDEPNTTSAGSSNIASEVSHPSDNLSHEPDGWHEPMEIDGERSPDYEEDEDALGEPNVPFDEDDDGDHRSAMLSSDEDDDGDHRSAILSSDEGSDGSEESELEETRDVNEEDSGYNAEVDPDEQMEQWLDELEMLARMQGKSTPFVTLLTSDAKPGADWESTYSFFRYKALSNTSDSSYDILRETVSRHNIEVRSLKTTRENLRALLHLRVRKYDSCIRGCMAFTGEHKLQGKCNSCGEPRFNCDNPADVPDFYENLEDIAKLTPRGTFTYIPLIPRLRLIYANKRWSRKMRYPKQLRETPWADGLEGVRDVWDAEMMRQWVAKGSHSMHPRI